jgi:hypothetical protein
MHGKAPDENVYNAMSALGNRWELGMPIADASTLASTLNISSTPLGVE